MAERQRILIVEDDPDTARMLQTYFENQGYEALTTAWGEEALRITQTVLPDLVVLDIRLPDIDGYQVCRRLRAQRRTERVPVIFLTLRSERVDRLLGLELGAVDFITKPFDLQELRLRVRNALRRARLGSLVNAITGLPTDRLVDERLTALLRQKEWALASIGIHGMRDFSDSYGFVAGDDVLRAAALTIKNVAQELGYGDPYIGHIGEADFVVITTAARASALCKLICDRLEQAVEYFYPHEAGQTPRQRPPISLHAGVITSEVGPFNSPMDIKVAALNVQKPCQILS